MRLLVLTGVFVGTFASACADVGSAAPTAITAAATQATSCPSAHSEPVFTYEHFVDVQGGARLHVLEHFTAASVLRPRHRAILFVTATLVPNLQFDAQVPGDDSYNALDRAAREGYFAFVASYEGYAESSHPANGLSVTFARIVPQIGDLVEWIRARRDVEHVDLIGSSVGSSVCVALGGIDSPIDPHHVGRLVLTALINRATTPLFAGAFAGLVGALESAPDGYFATTPPAYGLVLSQATPEALAWANATFPATYASGPTLAAATLPMTDPTHGRAPALEVWGDQDPIVPRSDVDQFQGEYGGPASLVVIPGGGHAPYYEAGREDFWRATFHFFADDDRDGRD